MGRVAANVFTRPLRIPAFTIALGLVAAGGVLTGIPALAATETTVPATDTPSTSSTAPADTGEHAAAATMELGETMFTTESIKNGIPFTVSGVEPGAELEVLVGRQNSEVYETPGDAPVADENGSYLGVAIVPEAWHDMRDGQLVGAYALQVRSENADGSETIAQADFMILPVEGEHTVDLDVGTDLKVKQFTAENTGVLYSVAGFRPGVELDVALTGPDGASIEFDSNEALVTDDYGFAKGTITGAQWPLGTYTLTVTDPETDEKGTLEFEIIASDDATDATDDATGDATTAPTTAPTSTAGGTQSDSDLASTGVEDYGPAGLALATLLVGAGAGSLIVSRRFTTE